MTWQSVGDEIVPSSVLLLLLVFLFHKVTSNTIHGAGTVSWAALATVVDSPSMAVAMVVVGSLGTACSDVVVDSIVVERSRGEPQVNDLIIAWLLDPYSSSHGSASTSLHALVFRAGHSVQNLTLLLLHGLCP